MATSTEPQSNKTKASLDDMPWDLLAVRSLPVDQDKNHLVQRPTPGVIYSEVQPTPMEKPYVAAFSKTALELLDLEHLEDPLNDKKLANYFGGCEVPPGALPIAHCYCGHQFGQFAGQLGDGRAITLGEIINSKGSRVELQMKGAGKTPYSRFADGRAVLRSSIREFLCSEHMAALGVPTSRAATLVVSDITKVMRDPLYDGHPVDEKCAVVLRLAQSFLRLGSWEIFRSGGPSAGNEVLCEQLTDYTIQNHFPEIYESITDGDEEIATKKRRAAFYKEVVKRTAHTVARWQAVGFVHGVLNTDNLSILGLTIDYGPYGFLDRFDPNYTPNHSDNGSRYCYRNQVAVCKWNLARFAEVLTFIMDMEDLRQGLDSYDSEFQAEYNRIFAGKMGFNTADETSKTVRDKFLETLEETAGDWTNSFRALTTLGNLKDTDSQNALVDALTNQSGTSTQLAYQRQPSLSRKQISMMKELPDEQKYIYERILGGPVDFDAMEKDWERFDELAKMDESEFRAQTRTKWEIFVQEYVSALEKAGMSNAEERRQILNASNPQYVLRQHLAQRAIAEAEAGDYTFLRKLQSVMEDPFTKLPESDDQIFGEKKPEWAETLCVSCSS
eukprot:Clim_evm9s171 gene=Clim_evmTU9s171